MRFLEFGDVSNKAIILIHGVQVPWQIMRPEIEYFARDYRVIVPILPGHDPEEKSTFYSIEKTAEEIEEYCIQHDMKKIFAICGMSMGGAIAVTLWENSRLHIEKISLDGAPLVPQNRISIWLITNSYLRLTHKTQKRDIKTLSVCEKNFIPKKYMPDFIKMIDNMSDETIRNFCSSVGEMVFPKNLKTTNIDIVYYYGSTMNEILSQKSARLLKKFYPQISVCCLSGYSHCEMSLYHKDEFIQKTEQFLISK